MSSEEQIKLDGLEKAVEKLASEIESLKKEMGVLTSLPRISDALKSLQSSVSGVKDDLSPITKIDGVFTSLKSIESGITTLAKDKGIQGIDKKVDGISKNIESLDSRFEKIANSDEVAALDKKIEDVLSSVSGLGKGLQQIQNDTRIDGLEKKLDELQKSVTDFSSIENTISELTSTFDETREIVSIIVRQLDDIERKYNKALGDMSEALKLVQDAIKSGSKVAEKPAPSEKATSTKKPVKKPKPSAGTGSALPATIDSIMDELLEMVTPHTEAIEMAEALETTRDQLTDLIKEHTPVIFQFGKIARELKSYPPTATLNENDIARLNKEIRAWTAKLKELAS